MKWVSFVQTSDGKIHRDALRAAEYAETRYQNALSSIAHRMVHQDKYTKMMEFVDAHLDEYVNLKALKDDIKLDKDEDQNADPRRVKL